jgi:hypothetical protein
MFKRRPACAFLCHVRAVLYGIETGDANTNVRQYLRHLAGKPLLYEREKT